MVCWQSRDGCLGILIAQRFYWTYFTLFLRDVVSKRTALTRRLLKKKSDALTMKIRQILKQVLRLLFFPSFLPAREGMSMRQL